MPSPIAKDEPVILMAAPIIENWAYTFAYALKAFGLKDTGHIRIAASNVTAIAGVKTLALSNGLFYPQLSFMHVDFGDTEIYVSRNPFKQWFAR